mmetsp:Transcript_45903/g.98385  ORF Transcript_45903/g.98385 Transcript_45903/m.98385 type:complete len:371 (+) Transcript_45903:1242-2354(+)
MHLDNNPFCIFLHAHQPDQREDKQTEEHQCREHHPMAFFDGGQRLERQNDASLCPSLCGGKISNCSLCHTVGQLPVDELRVFALHDCLQTARRILDLTTFVEGSSLNHFEDLLVRILVADSASLSLPNSGWFHPIWIGILAVINHPSSVGTTGRHTSRAISDHAIQSEEGGIVGVQVICLVLRLVEVLRALCEGDVFVERVARVEEIRDGGGHEIVLELMPGVSNAEQGGSVVLLLPVADIPILGTFRNLNHVIVDEVKTTCLTSRRPQWHKMFEWSRVFSSVDHFLGGLSKLQPVRVLQARDGSLVVPCTRSHMLDPVGAFVLNRLRSGHVVHAQHAGAIRRSPIQDVVHVHRLSGPLVVVGDISFEGI